MAEAAATAAVIAATAATVGAVADVLGGTSQAKTAFWDKQIMSKIGSSNNVKEILDALNKAVGVLRSKRLDYQNEVERHQMKVPSETYKDWIQRVMEIEDQVNYLVAKYDKQSEKSSSWFSSPSNLIEEIEKKHEQVIKLQEEGNQIGDKLLVDRPPESVVAMRAPDITKFETLQKPLEQVLELLRNDKVKGIRIHGAVGIGKTTIMLNLNNHEEVAKMFDIVIWVNVSKGGSTENSSGKDLQQAVLRRLKLNMRGTKHATDRISKELEGKKYLLLMDDVKEDLKLNEIGIPVGKNGSKIVLTTRYGHVCSSLVNRVIRVKKLSPDEAWEMFQDVLDRPDLIEDPKIAPLAWRVCNECDGLPLLIQKVANTFKVKNNENLWKEGLNSWRYWPQQYCQGILEMYNIFKFCYNDLDDAQKQCFLYGALYPENSDIHTDCLLECWAAEDFLGNDHHSNKQVLVAHVLSDLKNVSLLEETKSKEWVTMHKFVRQAALYISSDDPACKYLVKTNGGLQEPPDAESWSQKNRISLCDNKFKHLPHCPDCSMLSTLFLQKNLILKEVPETFFDSMKELRVLNLCETGIISLPSSLSKLIGLKVLYLCDCEDLMQLPSAIEVLQQLEVLDIRGSGIHNLPTHIKKLEGLRCLRISFDGTQEVDFDHNIISGLSALEELVVDMKSFDQWYNTVMVENIIKVAATLESLTSLKFSFPDRVVDVIEVAATSRIHVPTVGILQTVMNERSLWRKVEHIKSFQLFIASQNLAGPKIPDFYKYGWFIKYCNGEGTNPQIPELFAKAGAFELVEHKDIKKLSDFGVANMNQVRAFLIESCNEIETIIDRVDCSLEHFYVKSLRKLKSIWMDPIQLGSFTKLKTLVVSSCQMLESIFPPGVIQQLCQLEYLEIEKCSEIVEIFGESEGSRYPHVLPKLKEIILSDLPNLKYICANESVNWPSLEKLQSYNCPVLHEFPFTRAPKLRHFKME